MNAFGVDFRRLYGDLVDRGLLTLEPCGRVAKGSSHAPPIASGRAKSGAMEPALPRELLEDIWFDVGSQYDALPRNVARMLHESAKRGLLYVRKDRMVVFRADELPEHNAPLVLLLRAKIALLKGAPHECVALAVVAASRLVPGSSFPAGFDLLAQDIEWIRAELAVLLRDTAPLRDAVAAAVASLSRQGTEIS